jgi:hypothetical protein
VARSPKTFGKQKYYYRSPSPYRSSPQCAAQTMKLTVYFFGVDKSETSVIRLSYSVASLGGKSKRQLRRVLFFRFSGLQLFSKGEAIDA